MGTWPNPTDSGSEDAWPQAATQPGYAQDRAQLPPPAEQTLGMAQPQAAAWAYPPQGWVQAAAQPPGGGLAVASLVLGITSIVFCWWGLFSLAQVVLAIVFGCIGIGRANRGGTGRGQAVAGLTCGCVGAVAYLIFGLATLGVGFII